MMEGVKSTKIYCKNFGKCHNVPPVQQLEKHNKNKTKQLHQVRNFKSGEPRKRYNLIHAFQVGNSFFLAKVLAASGKSLQVSEMF
jgi:hypothetical protein